MCILSPEALIKSATIAQILTWQNSILNEARLLWHVWKVKQGLGVCPVLSWASAKVDELHPRELRSCWFLTQKRSCLSGRRKRPGAEPAVAIEPGPGPAAVAKSSRPLQLSHITQILQHALARNTTLPTLPLTSSELIVHQEEAIANKQRYSHNMTADQSPPKFWGINGPGLIC